MSRRHQQRHQPSRHGRSAIINAWMAKRGSKAAADVVLISVSVAREHTAMFLLAVAAEGLRIAILTCYALMIEKADSPIVLWYSNLLLQAQQDEVSGTQTVQCPGCSNHGSSGSLSDSKTPRRLIPGSESPKMRTLERNPSIGVSVFVSKPNTGQIRGPGCHRVPYIAQGFSA
ncbi:hypothetical protein B0J13DRAFT_212863 [Dactylonectria estremocensis]|uniref:Uncharacterized protein n=1 Tax=Dactylonectria estremocensis TaxID=1079267 RepID=A0A9P9JCH5_9HYPO|nr:hypothetical protein B0J13DRAFT_212863 [Dactylonectria estremocensis]